MTKLVLWTASLALTGCFLKSSVSTGSKPLAKQQSCPATIDQGFSAAHPCIINTDGTSDHVGETLSFTCKPFEVSRFVFVDGTDPFPVQVKVCWAAAYSGKLDPAAGGEVKIKILAAAHEYPAGEKRNGIKSQAVKSRDPIVGYTFVE